MNGAALGRLELAALALLLLAALAPRLRDAAAPLDRGFDGQQGAFFAIAAINYERLGPARSGGYPVLNVDLGDRADASERLWDRPEHWLVYSNHPPGVALLAWASLNALGPAGWNEAWRDGRGPEGFELALRFPFLVLHALALLALWWCVRAGHGARAGLVALALAAGSAPLVIYAGLVNYENAALPWVLLVAGLHSRFVRLGRRRDLLALALCAALGGAVTWAPLLFALALLMVALGSPAKQRGVIAALLAVACTAAPLALHALWATATLTRLGLPPAPAAQRAAELLAPLLDGSAPIAHWIDVQAPRWLTWFGLPALLVGVGGMVLALATMLRARWEFALVPRAHVPVALHLAVGGVLCQLAFYRHTLDEQTSFLMWLAPGFAATGAVLFEHLAPRLARLRAGLAPLVVLVSSVALVGLGRAQALRFGLRAAAGEQRPGLPAPELALPHETAAGVAAVLEPGEFGVYPAELGLNLAVALYAWRSLWPSTGPDDFAAALIAERVGRASAARRLILPDVAPASAAEASAALRPPPGEPPERSAAGWSAWRR